MAGRGLCREMLTFEPVRMVHMKQPLQAQGEEGGMGGGLKTLELSNLDQLYNYYNSLALFYEVKAGDSNIHSTHSPASKLQSALEELLIHYPAAAGRLHMNEANGRHEVRYKTALSASSAASIDDDYGLPFIVAHADTALSQLGDVSDPHPSLDLLYPSSPTRDHNNRPPPPVVLIQVTMFTCGSFTIGLAASHTLIDAYSVAVFLKNLCSIAKGEGLGVPMDMTNRREVVKPRVPPSPKVSHPHVHTRKREETPMKRELPYGNASKFAFSVTILEALRQRASGSSAKPCSRFQALAAFLWITRAKWLAKSGSSPSQEFPLRFPINMRGRELSTCSQAYIGCAILLHSVFANVQELCESSLAYVVRKIKSSMEGVHLQDNVQSEIDYIELQLQSGLLPFLGLPFGACLGIASLVNLPFYDTNCGWGHPIYCGRPSWQVAQRIIVLEDPQSKGWNVLVVMSSQEEHELFQEEIAKCISST